MRKYTKFLLLPLLLLLTACESSRHVDGYGDAECIGVDDMKDPKLTYEVSTRNVIVGLIFVETIIVPIVTVLDQFYCPVN